MTWRQVLGFVDDQTVDLATVQQRYQKLRDGHDYQVCERRRLRQAVESARREMALRNTIRQRTRFI